MKKEIKHLLERAINSLVLAIELFNRPTDRGRIEGVLIFLDHSFEMLLKASILYKGGKIREPRAKNTIGFDKCISKAVSDDKLKFLSKEQALTLSTLNGFRDAAYHHLVVGLSENLFYTISQASLTLFKDIYKKVYKKDVIHSLPARVLPLATIVPQDLISLFDTEVEEIKKLLGPKSRKQFDAHQKLRGLAIFNNVIIGERTQPTDSDLKALSKKILEGKIWQEMFPGVASINFQSEGEGININLRILKKEGFPIQLTSSSDGPVVAVKRVNELDYYSMGLKDLKMKLKLNQNETLALIYHFKIQESIDYFKNIKVGSQTHKRYSKQALEYIKNELPNVDLKEITRKYNASRR
jgi:hypothetical protein